MRQENLVNFGIPNEQKLESEPRDRSILDFSEDDDFLILYLLNYLFNSRVYAKDRLQSTHQRDVIVQYK